MMATLSSSRGMSSSLMFNVVMVEAGFNENSNQVEFYA